MRVLGLDLSGVATGWSIIDGDTPMPKILAKGLISFDPDMPDSAMSWYLGHEVAGIIGVYKPDVCAVESTYIGINPNSALVITRLAGVIQALWYGLMGKEVSFYPANTARATIGFNRGKLKGEELKNAVMDYVNEAFKLRKKIDNHNISDSVVIGLCAYLKRGVSMDTNLEGAKKSFGDEKSEGLGTVKKRSK